MSDAKVPIIWSEGTFETKGPILWSEGTFETLCRPLMDWLRANQSQHSMIIIDSESAELVHGAKSFKREE